MHKVLSRCPICTNQLAVQKLKCTQCGTIIENQFQLSKFDYLTPEQLYFAEIFIKCRGSIKEVEKELGISYPTVRSKLDEIILSLGYTSKDIKTPPPTKDILDALENGEISINEAINKLK